MADDPRYITKYNFKIENPRVSQWFQNLYVQPLVVKEGLFFKASLHKLCSFCFAFEDMTRLMYIELETVHERLYITVER